MLIPSHGSHYCFCLCFEFGFAFNSLSYSKGHETRKTGKNSFFFPCDGPENDFGTVASHYCFGLCFEFGFAFNSLSYSRGHETRKTGKNSFFFHATAPKTILIPSHGYQNGFGLCCKFGFQLIGRCITNETEVGKKLAKTVCFSMRRPSKRF